MTKHDIDIVPYVHVAGRPGLATELDEIFFEASSTRSFANENSRAEFRWRWLGRFLEQGAELAFLALSPDRAVAGYIVGSLSDPADPLDPELPYYARFAEQTRIYPAHLHINLDPRQRSRGTGARLIAAFGANAARCGAPGMHLVTSRGARNIRFYERCDFAEVASTDWNGRELVMLARTLRRS